MEAFKIDNYKKDFPLMELSFNVLKDNEISELFDLIKIKFHHCFQEKTIFQDFVRKSNANIVFEEINEGDGLEKLFSEMKITEKTVFVIWNAEEVDSFDTNILTKNWGYIWYPESDECVIMFLPSSNKLIMITDYCKIYW